MLAFVAGVLEVGNHARKKRFKHLPMRWPATDSHWWLWCAALRVDTIFILTHFGTRSRCVPVLWCRYIHCAAEYSICLLVCSPTQRPRAVQFHTFETRKVCTFTRRCAVSVLLHKKSKIYEIVTLKFRESNCNLSSARLLWQFCVYGGKRSS